MKQIARENHLILIALDKYTALSLKEIAYVTGLPFSNCQKIASQLLKTNDLTSFNERNVTYYKKLGIRNEYANFTELKDVPQAKSPLRDSRTCYNHLAGKLGVQVTQQLLKKGFIEEKPNFYQLTSHGVSFFKKLNLDPEKPISRKRKQMLESDTQILSGKKCLDWTERHFHLGGKLGKSITSQYQKLGWIESVPHERTIVVTEKGKTAFKKNLGI